VSDWEIVVAVAAALVLGLVASQWWTRQRSAAEEGFAVSELVNPVVTLSIVLLAFVVVEALSSYARAREDIGVEARKVDELGEAAGRVQDPAVSLALQQDLVCYARAVRFKEWKTMGASGARAPEVAVWTDAIKAQLNVLSAAGKDAQLNRLIDLDDTRGESRLARLTESNPTIPTGLTRLMFVSVAASLFGMAFFLRSRTNPGPQIAVLVILAVLLGGILHTINDLDHPFGGTNKLQPTEMARIQTSIEGDLATAFPGASLACDAQGVRP
jgi:hypothetical protein